MQDGTYLSRNSATLGPLTSQPPCVGRLTGRCRIQLDRLESGVLHGARRDLPCRPATADEIPESFPWARERGSRESPISDWATGRSVRSVAALRSTAPQLSVIFILDSTGRGKNEDGRQKAGRERWMSVACGTHTPKR